MTTREVEKAIKEVLKDGESYDITELKSIIFHHYGEIVEDAELEAILSKMFMNNIISISPEQVTKYFLTEEKSNEK